MKRILFNTKRTLAVATVLIAGASGLMAQPVYTSGNDPRLQISSAKATKMGDRMNVEFTVNEQPLLLTRDEKLVVTPMIINRTDTMRLEPMVFLAENQQKKEKRVRNLYKETPDYGQTYRKESFSRKEMRRKKRDLKNNAVTSGKSFNYASSVRFQPWMEGSRLELRSEVTGCNDHTRRHYSYLLPVYDPVSPQVIFVVPEVEAVKARSDAMTARIIFQVDKYQIRRDLYDNAAELDEIYRFTDNVVKNGDVVVTGISLVGYASPEASYSHNDRLSRNRVEALRSDLAGRYNIDRNIVSINHVAEDWDSLRSWVAASDLAHRNQVLNVIDNTTDPDARDAKIKAIDNGQTYAYLLHNVYPGLRRVNYEIGYTVMPFTVEKGREVLRTNPRHMSLNEFYQVAQSYPEGSPEFEEVFAVAVRYYPDDPVANHNMAAIAMKKGDYATAKRHMEKCRDYEFAQNNLGVLYVLDHDYVNGEEYLRRAMAAGSPEARYNYQNIYLLK